jgi:uncharacterized membrane protein YeiH
MIQATFNECLDFIGSFAFCLSGATLAKSRRMDVFGIYVLAVVTGFGGGFLRDLILGNHLPFLFRTPLCWIIALLSTILVFIPILSQRKLIPKLIQIFDAIGLAFFTVVGIKAGLDKNLFPSQCILMGLLTACFGGVIRDVLVNKIPSLFYREVYAVLSLAGGLFYLSMSHILSNPTLEFVTIGLIFLARIFAIFWELHLPNGKTKVS